MINNGNATSIYNFNFEDLSHILLDLTQKGFRAQQIWEGIYKHFYTSWNEFSTLPTELRTSLENRFIFSSLQVIQKLVSRDGKTEKYLFQFLDGSRIESVLLYKDSRITCCISTQSGCPVGCAFCATGHMGFNRNLSTGEIIDQFIFLARVVKNIGSKVDNLVLMGMGEPLINYNNSLNAVKIFNANNGLNLGARRITLSTIGIPDGIRRLASERLQINLAVSLHAADDDLRKRIVPYAKKYSLKDIMQACQSYIESTNRRITFEYVMINGLNDQPKDAISLGNLLRGLNCHVNLIPLNPNPHFDASPSSPETIKHFGGILLSHGIPVTVRFSQGDDIQAACGQLAAPEK